MTALAQQVAAAAIQTSANGTTQATAAAAAVQNGVPGVQSLVDGVNSMVTTAKGLSGALQSFGVQELGVFVGLVLSYEAVLLVLDNGSAYKSIATLIHKCIPICILAYVIQNYQSCFDSYITATFSAISAALIAKAGGTSVTDLGAVAKLIVNDAFILFNGTPSDAAGTATAAAASSTSWLSLSSILDHLLALLFRCVTAFLFVISGIFLVGQLVLAQIMLSIAEAVGPIMLPTLLIPTIAFLFDGWLKFTIISGFWQVIGAIMYAIVWGGLSHSNGTLSSALIGGDTGTIIGTGLVMVFLSLLAGYLMMEVPKIAQGLVSGGGGSGLSRHMFQAPMAMAKGGGGAAKMAGHAGYKGATKGIQSGAAGFRSLGKSLAAGERVSRAGGASGVRGAMNSAAVAARSVGRKQMKAGAQAARGVGSSVRKFHAKAMSAPILPKKSENTKK